MIPASSAEDLGVCHAAQTKALRHRHIAARPVIQGDRQI